MPLTIQRMTVVVEDGFVSINNQGYLGLDVSTAPSDVRAMQWYGTMGEEEMKYTPPNSPEPNRTINDLDQYQTIIAEWEQAANPPPPTPPTSEEVTTATMYKASGQLSSASYYTAPGVWETITPDSQTALQEWGAAVTLIMQTAQKILVDGTGESYAPVFPSMPTINPAPQAGLEFTVYFVAPTN